MRKRKAKKILKWVTVAHVCGENWQSKGVCLMTHYPRQKALKALKKLRDHKESVVWYSNKKYRHAEVEPDE